MRRILGRLANLQSIPLFIFLVAMANFSASTPLCQAQPLDQRITQIILLMNLEEKIAQLHREGGFNTSDNQRLNIPGFVMADGPHGVRDGRATSFPVGIAMAATWDRELVERIGVAMGKEFRAKGKHQALGPAVDLCRDPRNGRTPETGGEDPYLAAQITSALIKGIQSTGCIATAKHFNGVNRQLNRTTTNMSVSQRMLMEHYGLNFRTAVQDGGVMSVMNAYNLINGRKCAENRNLLTGILREQWGFPFYVVSDWNSIWNSEAAIKAGCNVCMGSDHYENDLLRLVQSGAVSESVIDDAVARVLRTKIMAGMLDTYPLGDPTDINSPVHQQLSLEAGRKCIVLLKNENDLLPLNKDDLDTIAVIGPSANVAQLDGSGSSYVTPFYSITPRQGIEGKVGRNRVLYAKGCDINSDRTTGFAEAKSLAAQADVVVFVGGLDTGQEGEGHDREGGAIALPGMQQDLINELSAVNSKLIVVIKSGGICGINRSIKNISALLYAFYPGQEGGNAIADVIFGDHNPGGKLPVTMPRTDSQLPEWNTNFDDDEGNGYRWFDKNPISPQFAFGHGLGYSSFRYSNLVIVPANAPAGQTVHVKVDVTNTGDREGEEVAQLYLTDDHSSVPMPVKQLKGFRRIALRPDQTRTVNFQLTPNELYFYDESSGQYKVEPGSFTVRVGGASDNLPLSQKFEIQPEPLKPDLLVARVNMIPPYPIEGDSVIFLAAVLNRGTGPSPEGKAHELEFLVSGERVSWSGYFEESIPAGGMALISANSGLYESSLWPAAETGEFEIEAMVDPADQIEETIEDNNRQTRSFTVSTSPPRNLALHASVTVSSVERSGLEGDKAVDGFLSTRWSSEFSDPQFIVVDLAAEVEIEELVLHWETAYGEEYLIQLSSDGVDWATMWHEKNGEGGIDRIPVSEVARFVRMYGIKRGTQWGYSLFELEVFGRAASVTGIDKNTPSVPNVYLLRDNYPNPFNPLTTISYEVPTPGNVKIDVYNTLGELVSTLVNAKHAPGVFQVQWSGTDFGGANVGSGVYFYRMELDGFSRTKRMLLLR